MQKMGEKTKEREREVLHHNNRFTCMGKIIKIIIYGYNISPKYKIYNMASFLKFLRTIKIAIEKKIFFVYPFLGKKNQKIKVY